MSATQLLSVAALQKSLIPVIKNADGWTELALAIHRGRDHGIPSYRHALDLCQEQYSGADSANITFESLAKISNIPEEHITTLRDIYQWVVAN